MMARLLLRVDADPSVGRGHVMRCIALAEAWRELGGAVHFIAEAGTEGLENRLRALGGLSSPSDGPRDSTETARMANAMGAMWTAIDGYGFGSDFERELTASGVRVLTVDDLGGTRDFLGTALLNQNAFADEGLYRGRKLPAIRMYGPRYALLRQEFRRRSRLRREHPARASRLLVSFGGGDSSGLVLKTIASLRLLAHSAPEAVILIGAEYPSHQEILKAAAGLAVPARIEVDADDVADWMMWAEFAILGGGTSVWEACLLGLPSILVEVADNQRRTVEWAKSHGVAETLGKQADVTPDAIALRLAELAADSSRRKLLGSAGPCLVDGNGAFRVCERLLDSARRS